MKKVMKGKGRGVRIGIKMEKIIIAAIILVAFVGAVKKSLWFYTPKRG